MSIEWVIVSNHLTLCRPLLLPSVFPNITVFSNEPALHIREPKKWSFRFSISPSNEYSGLISFRIDWFELFVVQGTLTSLLEHQNSKTSMLWCSAFFIVQLSNVYMTTCTWLPIRTAIIKKYIHNKCWRGCGEKGILLHCCWECKLVQLLWSTVYGGSSKNKK